MNDQNGTDAGGDLFDKVSKRDVMRDDARYAERAHDPDEPWLDPLDSFDPSNRDPATGRLLPGHTIPGPGRPKGSLDFMQICRSKSREAGIKLSDVVWLVTKGLAARAAKGDAAAAKVLLDRLCGPVDKALVEVDARTLVANAGPPIPEGGEFSEWVHDLNKVAAQQGLLGDATPAQIVDAAVAEVAEVADLLG